MNSPVSGNLSGESERIKNVKPKSFFCVAQLLTQISLKYGLLKTAE
jgi:hypothetical protein